MNLHQVKIEGFFGIKASSEKIVLPTQSSGEMLRARLLDDIRKDDLLDDNDLPSTMKSGMNTDRTPGIIEPGYEDEVDGRGAQSGAVMPAPSVVQGGSAHTPSQHSQPASQPTQRSGQNILDSSNNPVMLGTPAGAVGGAPGTQRVCHHTKDGVCSLHGPGAKWMWRPVPVKNPVPGGKRTRKEHFWKCEVNMRGKTMKQTRISFGQMNNNVDRGDNKGDEGNILTDRTKGE